MELLLTVSCLSLLGLAVACLAFGAATRNPEAPPEAAARRDTAVAVAPARFFTATPIPPVAMPPRVPIEVLLLQIENHVRLEQAAAESFLESPTPALLHSRTTSPLVN